MINTKKVRIIEIVYFKNYITCYWTSKITTKVNVDDFDLFIIKEIYKNLPHKFQQNVFVEWLDKHNLWNRDYELYLKKYEL